MRKTCLIVMFCMLMIGIITVVSGRTIYVDDDEGKDYQSNDNENSYISS